jgi:Tol biopolymer transport system component
MALNLSTHHRSRLLSFIILLAIVPSAPLSPSSRITAQTPAGKAPLTHETMWMMKRVGAPNPSPDGKWVVFSLSEPAYDEKDQVSDLWIVPTDATAKPRRLTFTKSVESGVVWSADSQRLAFSAKREGTMRIKFMYSTSQKVARPCV